MIALVGSARAIAVTAVLAIVGCKVGGDAGTELGSDDSADGTETGERFDAAGGDAKNDDCDGAGNGGGNGGDDYDFINLWVANSPDGTVSKIDTRKQAEVARYRTGPGDDDPSRTSVNLLGDMVVVNRAGSITKILGGATECPDLNDTPGIQTSTGSDDVLAWGEDDCVVWHRELTDSTGADNRWGAASGGLGGRTGRPDDVQRQPARVGGLVRRAREQRRVSAPRGRDREDPRHGQRALVGGRLGSLRRRRQQGGGTFG